MPLQTARCRHTVWLVRSQKALCVLMGCIVLDACASPPSVDGLAPTEQVNDPLEPANREIYAFNTKARHVLEPMVEQAGILGPLWHGIHNVLVNLREPLVFSNDLAQGRDCAAGASLRRFMVNSTLGIGGIFDVGQKFGIEAHDNDFGQTLAAWGLPPGPFLMLPVLGPSDLRGTTGTAVEYFADPVDIGFRSAGLLASTWPLGGMDVADREIDASSDLDSLERTSLDGYAALRSAYRQNLEHSIADDKCPSQLMVAGASGNSRAPPER